MNDKIWILSDMYAKKLSSQKGRSATMFIVILGNVRANHLVQ